MQQSIGLAGPLIHRHGCFNEIVSDFRVFDTESVDNGFSQSLRVIHLL